MSNTTQAKPAQGFTWDKRGRVTAAWVQRDLNYWERLRSAEQDPVTEEKAAQIRQRIADQLNAYITKVEAGGVVMKKTLRSMTELSERFDALAGTDLLGRITAAAAHRLADRKPVPWDVRGRVVPTWLARAARTVQKKHRHLAESEKLLASQQDPRARAKASLRVENRRKAVEAAERRLAEMVEHSKQQIDRAVYSPFDASVKKIEHIASSVEDVRATAAIAAANSFSHERYVDLHARLKSVVASMARKRGFLREFEDACQQGALGIRHAATLWSVDHDSRAKFSTYAPQWIGRFMECRSDDGLAPGKSRPGHPRMNSMSHHDDDEGRADQWHPSTEDHHEENLTAQSLLNRLDPVERSVIEAVVMKGATVKAVAASMGLTPAKTRAIRERALEKMR